MSDAPIPIGPIKSFSNANVTGHYAIYQSLELGVQPIAMLIPGLEKHAVPIFSTKAKCQEAIQNWLKLPGVEEKDYHIKIIKNGEVFIELFVGLEKLCVRDPHYDFSTQKVRYEALAVRARVDAKMLVFSKNDL